MSENILQALRAQAWERAKGEMQAMLATHAHSENAYWRLQEKIKAFVAEVEGAALHE